MREALLADLISSSGRRAGASVDAPVYSVTKHAGFVPSLEYFKKQVFSRDLAGYRLVEQGDFAYATIHLDEGSIGIAPEAALISPMYTVFRADASKVDSAFLIRYLKSPRALHLYESLGKGAVHRRKAISLQALGTMPVPLPPLDEQQRIAAILDKADEIRTKRREALAHLDLLAQSLMSAVAAKTATEESLGELVIDGPKNGLYLPASEYGSGTPIVRINSFRFGTGRLEPEPLRRVRATEAQVREFGLSVGDILINRVNSQEHVGKSALIRTLEEPAVFESNMMRLRLDPARVDPRFAIEALQQAGVYRQIAPMVKPAVNQASINQRDVRAIRIPLPAIEVQGEFSTRVASIDTQRAAVERALAADDELFASLQSRAFRGEL